MLTELTPQELIDARTNKGLSQQEVADYVGISQRTYSGYEKGEIKPKIDKMAKLLEVLGVKTLNFSGKEIPLIPLDAMAGQGRGEFEIRPEDILENYLIPDFDKSGVKFLIRVSGSSMMPKYSNGDLLGCRPIEDWSFFQWGKPYVLDTDQGAIVKRLYPVDGEDEVYECRSDNYKMYPPFKIKKTAIYRIAIVIGVIRRE